MRRFSPYLLAACIALPALGHAVDQDCEGVHFDRQATFDGASLSLNGLGVREATFLNINVYVAALYAEHTGTNAASLLSQPQHLRLVQHFVRNVSHSQISDAMTESFHNAPGGTQASLQPRLQQLIAMLAPCPDGTVVTYSYTPGTGLYVSYGSRSVGTIPGDDFAQVFFQIFVGPNPPNRGLRTGLLGGHCG